MTMNFIETSKKMFVSDAFVDIETWKTVCDAETGFKVPPVDLPSGPLPYLITEAVPNTREELVVKNAANRAAFIALVAKYVVGTSWFQSVVWCNAASVYLGYDPLYVYDNKVVTGLDVAQVRKNKLNIPTVKNGNGIRLPDVREWNAFTKNALIKTVLGVKEWTMDLVSGADKRERVLIGTDGQESCNGYFALPYVCFRVVREDK